MNLEIIIETVASKSVLLWCDGSFILAVVSYCENIGLNDRKIYCFDLSFLLK